jgi:thiol-disulfide isomerase/thioredoxin
MTRRILALAIGAVLALGGRAAAEVLSVGDPAPKLEVKEFVKGENVPSLEKGKVYVVEFWATWCGPCRTSIPHLTELQKKNKDAIFIGVSVWEQDQAKVQPFVKEMGDKMDYRVALDDVGEGKGNDGKMAKNWMQAAQADGIPTAFIVDRGGMVAWIGHPMQMEKPLEQILSGKWDLAKASADYKAEKARAAKFRALIPKLGAADGSKDYKTIVALVDEALKDDPEFEKNFGMILGNVKLNALVMMGDADKTVQYGKQIVEKLDQPQALNDIAWTLVEKPSDMANPKLMKFALEVALKANKLAEDKDGAILDTLAKAYYENGQFAKALETQERAVKLVKGTPQENDKGIQKRLELYKEKAAKP